MGPNIIPNKLSVAQKKLTLSLQQTGIFPQQLHAPQADLEGAQALALRQAYGRRWEWWRLSQVRYIFVRFSRVSRGIGGCAKRPFSFTHLEKLEIL